MDRRIGADRTLVEMLDWARVSTCSRRSVAVVVLVLGAVALGACTHDSSSDSETGRTPVEGQPAGKGPCPRTPGERPNPDIGIALGTGPAYAVLGFEGRKNVVELTADELRGGSFWHKTLWAIDPDYDGRVLVRGRGIDPPERIAFGYDGRALAELEFPAEETDRWRYGPSDTILPGPGCYAFEVGGSGFRDVIVFQAVKSRELALEGKPQVGVLRLGDGRASARFTVTALDPPTHTYDVRVQSAASADISVSMRTWYGQRLRVLDSIESDRACRTRRGRADCNFAFPALEAQRPGRWTVIVKKRSGPPGSVRVAVTFNSL
jgi:hypothetical protein